MLQIDTLFFAVFAIELLLIIFSEFPKCLKNADFYREIFLLVLHLLSRE